MFHTFYETYVSSIEIPYEGNAYFEDKIGSFSALTMTPT